MKNFPYILNINYFAAWVRTCSLIFACACLFISAAAHAQEGAVEIETALASEVSEHIEVLADVGVDVAGEVAQLDGLLESIETGGADVWGLLNQTLFTVNETNINVLGLLRMLLILGLFWLATKLVGRLFNRLQRRQNVSAAAAYAFNQLFRYGLIVAGFFVALSSVGIDLSQLALFVSALGVGLGFGLQAIINNFVSGLILLFERSLKIGDFVELESGVTGKVTEINVRSTIITTNDNIDILVPNSEFVNGRVTNWTLRDSDRRVRIPFGVAYGTDKELVKRAALEAAESVPFTLPDDGTRRTQVWLMEFGDSSLNYELVVWITGGAVARPSAVHAAYTWAVETALAKYGLEIPFPQRDLNVRTFFGLENEDAVEAITGKRMRGADDAQQKKDKAAAQLKAGNDAVGEALEGIEEHEAEKAEQAAAEKAAEAESEVGRIKKEG